MPCCIGIIDYAQCRHRTLLKLGCTRGCAELCAPGQQEVLLRTRFRWQCEECHWLRSASEADARIDGWEDKVKRVDADQRLTAAARRTHVLALREREDFEEQLLEERRMAQVEEIQLAGEWTSDYGRAVFAKRYAKEPVDGRIAALRRLQRWDLVVVADTLRSAKELRELRDARPRRDSGAAGVVDDDERLGAWRRRGTALSGRAQGRTRAPGRAETGRRDAVRHGPRPPGALRR